MFIQSAIVIKAALSSATVNYSLYKVDVTFEALVEPVSNKIKACAKALSILCCCSLFCLRLIFFD